MLFSFLFLENPVSSILLKPRVCLTQTNKTKSGTRQRECYIKHAIICCYFYYNDVDKCLWICAGDCTQINGNCTFLCNHIFRLVASSDIVNSAPPFFVLTFSFFNITDKNSVIITAPTLKYKSWPTWMVSPLNSHNKPVKSFLWLFPFCR